jgi:hypothetical protein
VQTQEPAVPEAALSGRFGAISRGIIALDSVYVIMPFRQLHADDAFESMLSGEPRTARHLSYPALRVTVCAGP